MRVSKCRESQTDSRAFARFRQDGKAAAKVLRPEAHGQEAVAARCHNRVKPLAVVTDEQGEQPTLPPHFHPNIRTFSIFDGVVECFPVKQQQFPSFFVTQFQVFEIGLHVEVQRDALGGE